MDKCVTLCSADRALGAWKRGIFKKKNGTQPTHTLWSHSNWLTIIGEQRISAQWLEVVEDAERDKRKFSTFCRCRCVRRIIIIIRLMQPAYTHKQIYAFRSFRALVFLFVVASLCFWFPFLFFILISWNANGEMGVERLGGVSVRERERERDVTETNRICIKFQRKQAHRVRIKCRRVQATGIELMCPFLGRKKIVGMPQGLLPQNEGDPMRMGKREKESVCVYWSERWKRDQNWCDKNAGRDEIKDARIPFSRQVHDVRSSRTELLPPLTDVSECEGL